VGGVLGGRRLHAVLHDHVVDRQLGGGFLGLPRGGDEGPDSVDVHADPQ
jgi:hypothetical protein